MVAVAFIGVDFVDTNAKILTGFIGTIVGVNLAMLSFEPVVANALHFRVK